MPREFATLYANSAFDFPTGLWDAVWASPELPYLVRLPQLMHDGEVYVSNSVADEFIRIVSAIPGSVDKESGSAAFLVLHSPPTEAELRLRTLSQDAHHRWKEERVASRYSGKSPSTPAIQTPTVQPPPVTDLLADFQLESVEDAEDSDAAAIEQLADVASIEGAQPTVTNTAPEVVPATLPSRTDPSTPERLRSGPGVLRLSLGILPSITFLGLAVLDSYPSIFYLTLRSIVTVTALWLAGFAFDAHRRLGFLLIGVAILFNPFLPIYLGVRQLWLPIDFAVAVIFGFAAMRLRHASDQ